MIFGSPASQEDILNLQAALLRMNRAVELLTRQVMDLKRENEVMETFIDDIYWNIQVKRDQGKNLAVSERKGAAFEPGRPAPQL